MDEIYNKYLNYRDNNNNENSIIHNVIIKR